MSNSYKKTPVYKDLPSGKKGQIQANRTVRRKLKGANELPQRKAYKKFYCSWEIHDWVNYWSLEDAKAQYEELQQQDWFKKKYPTEQDFLNKIWYKGYRRK